MSGSAKVIGAIDVSDLFAPVTAEKPEGYHTCDEVAKASGRSESTVRTRLSAMRRNGQIDCMMVGDGRQRCWAYRVNL